MKDMMLQDEKTIMPEVGLKATELQGINIILSKALASNVILQYKTKKYHWNVTGPNFQQLHELFDEQYNQLLPLAYDYAEYIRTYGQMSPGTFTEFSELSIIEEKPGYNPSALEMVAELVEDHEKIIRSLRKGADTVADKYNDPQVEDLFVAAIHKHQKMAWFLRAHLENNKSNQ